ncbi:hypothetical protein SODALDRAFT_59623 [Sodiomyces alkalinus F11]|uniref:F-box domain-containing protein n=1 Tax=Sodiomyces alkalinus (strain CBS 110278 / VKM F-3762 / F11) TaxID=1314773 RepID=A0A3N2PL42_SODAK|nr:hypothetical protein SODALDRAFT_59623 [Sodiomyces alkalinus F11]ROT35248.1 hypothetical protein SODALDRAFT_59623 [Sodiomyces alkalinus F11]
MAEKSPLPPLLRIPLDIRMLIYEYLLDDCGNRNLEIRHLPLGQGQQIARSKKRRSSYRIIEPSLRRRCYYMTYALACNAEMHTAFMATNRLLHSEASWFLYGRHTFSFDTDIEAVDPFLGDLTPPTRELVRSIAVRKQSAVRWPGSGSDPIDWSHMCRHLQDDLPNLRHLRITVEGDLPPPPALDSHRESVPSWKPEPPRPLEVSDFRLLCHIKHDSVSWIRDLAGFHNKSKGLGMLEVVADVRPTSVAAETTEAIVHAALSLCIETAFVEFLRSDLRLPAVCVPSTWRRGGRW